MASAVVSESGEVLTVQLNPPIELGQTMNVVFHGFNPQFSVYQWSTELLADGDDPVRYLGLTLRLNVYEPDMYR